MNMSMSVGCRPNTRRSDPVSGMSVYANTGHSTHVVPSIVAVLFQTLSAPLAAKLKPSGRGETRGGSQTR